jgi:hypothetical protein
MRALAIIPALATTLTATALALGADGSRSDDNSRSAALRDAQVEAGRREERRRSPDARAERQRSRTLYADASDERALEIARDEFASLVSDPLWRGIVLQRGERLRRYLGDYSALVEHANGEQSLVESSGPLRAATESGAKAPIDLDFEPVGGGDLVPRNPLARTRFSTRAAGGVHFERSGVTVAPVTGRGSARSQRAGGKLFFANTDTDTDYFAAPMPEGFEAFLQLRSEQSPRHHELRFELPSGASLDLDEHAGGAPGAKVARGKQALLTIAPPRAFDADGEAVPAVYRVTGNRLRIDVRHADGDFRYPIVVDPLVNEDFYFYMTDKRLHRWRTASSSAGWDIFQIGDTPDPRNTFGYGLYVNSRPNIFDGPAWGEWNWKAYGNSSIQRADVYRTNFAHNGTGACLERYIRRGDGGGVEGTWHFVCGQDIVNNGPGSYVLLCADPAPDNGGCKYEGATRGNSLVFRESLATGAFRTTSAISRFAVAAMHLMDYEPPQWVPFSLRQQGAGAAGEWVREGSGTVTLEGTDHGLGVKEFDVWIPKAGGGYNQLQRIHPCAGDRYDRCPSTDDGLTPYEQQNYPRPPTTWAQTLTYDVAGQPGNPDANADPMAEGINQIDAGIYDMVHNSQPSNPFATVRVDRSEPQVSLSGPLKERENQELPDGTYELVVDASDGAQNGANQDRRSGVTGIDIVVDGDLVDTKREPCASDSCPLSHRWTFDTSAYPGGAHLVEVTARDRVGLSRTARFAVRTHCCSSTPSVWGATGGFFETAFGDVDGDGLDDAIRRDRLFPDVRVGLATGSNFGAFDRRWVEWNQLLSLAVGDVTGDGRADLVGRHAQTNELFVARSTGSAFDAPQRFGTWPAARDLHVADVDGDGRVDAAGRDRISNDVWVAYSTGSAFGAATVQARWDAAYDLHIADVNADASGDLVGRHVQSGDLRVALANDVGFDGPTSWGRSDPLQTEMHLADMNGDGFADVVTRFTATGVVRVAPSEETRFGPAVIYEPPLPADYELALADPTGEGQFDVLGVSRDADGEIRLHPTDVMEPVHVETEEWIPDSAPAFYDLDDLQRVDGSAVTSSNNPACSGSGLKLMAQDEYWLTYGALPDRNPAHVQAVFSRAHELGACFIRMNISWGTAENWTAENAPRSYYFEQAGNIYDAAIDKAKAEGFRVYLTVTGAVDDCATFTNPATGAKTRVNPNGLGCIAPGSTGVSPDPVRFGEFAGRVAARYKSKLEHFAVWNEPNIPGFLLAEPDQEDVIPARRYGQLYAEAYKKMNPHRVRILIGELASGARGRRYEGEDPSVHRRVRAHTAFRFLENAVEAAAARLGTSTVTTHGVAWHPYQHTVAPTTVMNGKEVPTRTDTAHFGIGRIIPLRKKLQALHGGTGNSGNKGLVAPGGKQPPLYMSEFGYLNRPRPSGGKGRHKTWHTEQRRAGWWRSALDLALRESRRKDGAGPRLMTIYQLVEASPKRGTPPEFPQPEFPKCTGSHPAGPGCVIHTDDYGLVSDGAEFPPFGTSQPFAWARGDRPYGRAPKGVKNIFFRQRRQAFCSIVEWSFAYRPRDFVNAQCAPFSG